VAEVEVFSEVKSASTPKHTKCQKFLRLKPNHVIKVCSSPRSALEGKLLD